MSPLSPSGGLVRFSDFEADLSSGELHKHGIRIKLQVQPFQVLQVLLEHPGEVVTREELQKRIWPADTFVDFDHGLNNAVKKLREALGDDAEKHRFIETHSKRGYRFIGAVETILDRPTLSSRTFRAASGLVPAHSHLVGREKENAELGAAFESAAEGRGLLVCVAGEPGIGKTTLVQDFLSGLQARSKGFDLAIGRCSQRLAGEEAYLPFLEALESLLRHHGGAARKLRELAPSWYSQLFPLSESDPSDARLREYVRTMTQERVKREFTAFICDITRQTPLVLFFDDVHWTDPSTVDLLAHLATRFEGTKILVIVTYRPTELLLLKHPFTGVKRDLQARSACREIEVEFLSGGDVQRYIGLEFPENHFPREFAEMIHARTEGNPLFMVDLLRYLRDRKVIVKSDDDRNWLLAKSLPNLSREIPQSVSSVIERKIDQVCDRDREVLTAAAVEGYEFDSATLARALQADSVEIEELLQRLERVNGFVKRVAEDEFPDGTPSVRCRFVHVLYQNALDAALTPTRRVALSVALARGLESFYGGEVSGIASQLGFLYEAARDPGHASDYFLLAAQNAQRIFANQEAIALAQRGLALLNKIPKSPERTRKELDLQVTLAFSYLCSLGYAAPETGANMARARELCGALGDAASLFPILFGLWVYTHCKGDLQAAREIAEDMTSISRDQNDPALVLGAHAALGFTLHHQGELVAARREWEEVATVYDVTQHMRYLQLYRLDLGIDAECGMVRLLWLLGFPDQALRKIEETLVLARGLSSPMSLAFCQLFAATLHQQLCKPEKARDIGEECIALCDEHGITLERAWVECLYGWAVAELGRVEEGISHIRAGLDTQLSVGNQIVRPHWLAVLTETFWHAGRTEEAMQAVEEGLAVSERNGERYYDAELWRLKGELVKLQDKTAVAEDCFHKALEISRLQSAKSLELRAATSLARLWQKQGKPKEALQMLHETYAWFTEGFDTADLQEARSLLQELS